MHFLSTTQGDPALPFSGAPLWQVPAVLELMRQERRGGRRALLLPTSVYGHGSSPSHSEKIGHGRWTEEALPAAGESGPKIKS